VAKRTSGVEMDFERAIGRGENPLGLTAQTVNGTAHWRGTGWNRDGPNYGVIPDRAPAWTSPDHQVRPDATRPDGRSNRTGE
jgi:hypothetical protein